MSPATISRPPATKARRPAARPGGRPPRRRAATRPLPNQSKRVRVLFLAVLFVFTLYGAQLLRVQAFEASPVQLAALNKRLTNKIALPAQRGDILDKNGVVLATSVERRTLSVNQEAIREYRRSVEGKKTKVGVVGAAQVLAPLLGTTPDALVPALMGTSPYRVIAKGVSPLTWQQISELGIPGIYSEATYERVYPAGMAAAPVTGAVNMDQAPSGGMEAAMESDLAGTPGELQYERARDGKPIPWGDQRGTEAVPGRHVVSTIDSDLQWYAQNAIAAQVSKTQALSGYVVVMEAKTGKVRALASYPTLDPGTPKSWTADMLRNHAIEDVYEPGSTGKVMSVAAALEEKTVTPTTGLVVPNRLPRGGKDFKDHEEHGTLGLTVAGALAKSSNIGIILATESVPPATMERYFRSFGMAAKTGLALPGESAGLLTPAGELSASQRYTMLFGQGYALTAVQSAQVYQTIANGGVRVAPSLLEGTREGSGPLVPAPQNQGTRVVSQATARQVSEMLEEVVTPQGTAPKVALPGYRIAGKTGTANRYDESTGRYNGYTTSFIGFAPADDARFVVAVTLQRPQVGGISGSGLAGPVFKDVMAQALQAYRVPPSGSEPPAVPLTTTGAAGDPPVTGERRPNG